MRKLFIIAIASLLSLSGFAQSETHNFITYDTSFVYATDAFHSVTYLIRISRPANMFTAGDPDTASRPAIITMPGQGEMGTDASKLQTYGPHFWLNNGWDGGVVLPNGKHYPILITMICSYSFPDPSWNLAVLNYLLNNYHIKRNSVHLAGLSQGAFTWSAMITYEATAGGEDGMKPVTSLALLSGAAQINPPGYKYFGRWAKKYGGHAWITVNPGDAQAPNPPLAAKAMNDSVNGSAYFAYNNLTSGGQPHCCWNTEYNPSITNWQSFSPLGTYITTGTDTNSRGTYQTGDNLYQWMLKQGDQTLVGSTQLTILKPIIMEYWTAYFCSDSSIYAYVGSSATPIQMPLPGGRKVYDASGCFNLVRATATDGTIWASSQYNFGSNTWVQENDDTTGATITDAKQIFGFADEFVFIRSNGTTWLGGNDTNHIFYASGHNIIRPTQISPTGVSFSKISIGNVRIVGLATNGDVYEWLAGAKNSPAKKILPLSGKAIDIATGHFDLAAAIVPKTTGSQLMGYPCFWGTSWGGWGDIAPGHTYSQPTDISALWQLTVPIRRISINWNTTHFIDSLGHLKGFGYNSNGEVGNGKEYVGDYTYVNYPHLGWTFNNFENPVAAPPVDVSLGLKWDDIWDNNWFAFFKYARTINGDYFFAGRAKADVDANGVQVSVANNTTDPNYDDHPVFTKVTPLTAVRVTYNLALAVRGAGTNQTISSTSTTIGVTGTPVRLTHPTNGSLYCCSFAGYQWMQTQGPAGVTITNPTSASTTVTGLTTGVYRFRVLTTDTRGALDTASVQIIVNITGTPPTVVAGFDQTISLPTSSTSLSGTATANGGASMSSTIWTFRSGPTTPTIGTPNNLITTVSGLTVPGDYVFQLSGTDSNNNTSTDQLTVTVLPVPPATNGGYLYFPKKTHLGNKN